MDENSIKKSVYAILAAEPPWAFTSRMAWSPRFLSNAPIELGRGFFTPPPLCPELCTCFHILKMQSPPLGLTTLAEPLQTLPSPGLCAPHRLAAASSSELVPCWEVTRVRLQGYFSPAHFTFWTSSSNCCNPFNPANPSNARLLMNWWVGCPFTWLSPPEKVLMDIWR